MLPLPRLQVQHGSGLCTKSGRLLFDDEYMLYKDLRHKDAETAYSENKHTTPTIQAEIWEHVSSYRESFEATRATGKKQAWALYCGKVLHICRRFRKSGSAPACFLSHAPSGRDEHGQRVNASVSLGGPPVCGHLKWDFVQELIPRCLGLGHVHDSCVCVGPLLWAAPSIGGRHRSSRHSWRRSSRQLAWLAFLIVVAIASPVLQEMMFLVLPWRKGFDLRRGEAHSGWCWCRESFARQAWESEIPCKEIAPSDGVDWDGERLVL